MERSENKERRERLQYVLGLSKMTRAQFSKRIGMDPSNFSKYLGGRLPINETLINRVVLDIGVSRRWLRDGIGTPFEKDLHARQITSDDTEASAIKPAAEGVPVYDIDVMAGTYPLSKMFTDDRIIGRVTMPQISRESIIVRVSGDSMDPVIREGAYINIRPVNSNIIFWGQMYVVILDDYRMVKFLRRHEDKNRVILHSANPAYDDIEIDRDEIRGLYLVESVMNFDLRC